MKTTYLLALAPVLVLGACTRANLPVPPELAGATQLPVQGRTGSAYDERIRFGSFSTNRVNRSWTDRQITPGLISRERHEWQDYRFTLREDSADIARESCRSYAANRVSRLGPGTVINEDQSGRLDCTVTPSGDSTRVWRMQLRADVQGRLRGQLTGPGPAFTVEGSNAIGAGRGCCLSAGYYIRAADGRTLAAVQTVSAGTIWLDPAVRAGERRLVAAAAAALLAYEPLGYY